MPFWTSSAGGDYVHSVKSALVATLCVGLVAFATPRQSAQAPAITDVERSQLAARVRSEFQFAWSSYTRLAWDHDELNPISRTVHDWYPPAVFYMTPVDALDTMTLMGLDDEASRTRQFLLERLGFDRDVSVQVFEVTIRILGGLITSTLLNLFLLPPLYARFGRPVGNVKQD